MAIARFFSRACAQTFVRYLRSAAIAAPVAVPLRIRLSRLPLRRLVCRRPSHVPATLPDASQ